MLRVTHIFLAMIYPPSLHQGVSVVAGIAIVTFDVTEDGKFLGLLIGQGRHMWM